jgi:hypothetical protein
VTSDSRPPAESAKGFAGLSSLVSNVETAPDGDTGHAAGSESERGARDEALRSSPNEAPTEGPQTDRPSEPNGVSASLGGSSVGRWALAIGVGIGALWMFSVAFGPKDSGSAGPEQAVAAPTATSRTPSPTGPPVRSGSPSIHPTEERPPVGTDNVLSAAQITYCLSEDVRLEAARGAISAYVDADLARFNSMVADYNSRCGRFRYRPGALEAARSAVERNRDTLAAEGRGRFIRTLGAEGQQAPSWTSPVPSSQLEPRRGESTISGSSTAGASSAEERNAAAVYRERARRAGEAERIMARTRFRLQGAVESRSEPEGSGGYWDFHVRLDDGRRAAFQCGSADRFLVRIGERDVSDDEGYEALGTGSKRVSLFLTEEDHRFVTTCPSEPCTALCPLVIVINSSG